MIEQDVSPAEAEDVVADATSDGAEGEIVQTPRMVPVSESIRYRRRAQLAERKATELASECDELRRSLEATREQMEAVERRQRIDALLVEADAIDLEAARLLTEAAVMQMDEADVEEAVRELRQKKPYLFRTPTARPAGGTLSPRPRRNGRGLNDAAETAALSGDRRDLLRYLRMRRRK
ncbi:MAG: hypothetical protein GC162_16840 [Planctomycetes bacterium]|nr:hypothetical protein [Planctomycetota bacterium]